MLEPESKKRVDLVQMGEAKNGRNRAGEKNKARV